MRIRVSLAERFQFNNNATLDVCSLNRVLLDSTCTTKRILFTISTVVEIYVLLLCVWIGRILTALHSMAHKILRTDLLLLLQIFFAFHWLIQNLKKQRQNREPEIISATFLGQCHTPYFCMMNIVHTVIAYSFRLTINATTPPLLPLVATALSIFTIHNTAALCKLQIQIQSSLIRLLVKNYMLVSANKSSIKTVRLAEAFG